MAQHDMNIANQGFPAFRTDLNNALSALNSMHSGTSRPSGATTGTMWLDTTNSGSNSLTIKFFDGSDDISFATIDTSANTVNFIDSTVASDLLNDTTPQLGGNLDTNSHNILIDDAHFIGDENGNEQIIFQTTSSAVNQIDITNAATGSGPTISSTGGDSNINLNLTPKGSGVVMIDGNVGIDSGTIDLKNGGSVSNIKFYCESSNAHYTALQSAAHSAYSGNVTLTLPASTDTIAGIAASQTLTNKTITASSNSVGLGTLDIDGGTDIGAALADADLFIVDDGAGGTNRKVAASRIITYVDANAGFASKGFATAMAIAL